MMPYGLENAYYTDKFEIGETRIICNNQIKKYYPLSN